MRSPAWFTPSLGRRPTYTTSTRPKRCCMAKKRMCTADARYQGIEKCREAAAVCWHVAMRPGRRRQLNLSDRLDAIYDQIERLKAGIRAKVEYPFLCPQTAVSLHEDPVSWL